MFNKLWLLNLSVLLSSMNDKLWLLEVNYKTFTYEESFLSSWIDSLIVDVDIGESKNSNSRCSTVVLSVTMLHTFSNNHLYVTHLWYTQI